MSVNALGAYDFAPRDTRGNFPAPLLYIGWDDHLMFCAPVCLPLPADTPFGALAGAILPGVYGLHPEFSKIDWNKVEWFKSGQPWSPDGSKTLEGNGLKHKDAIRFRTPGLTGIKGSHA